MTMNKIFRYSLMLLMSVVAFASCTEDYEYTGATAEGEQVYFKTTLGSTYELTKNDKSVEIPVNRINSKGAVTLPITVTAPENSEYTVPTEVTFADGETTANLVVTFDASNMTYGQSETITVALGDEKYSTPYGRSYYTFTLGMSEWRTMEGKAQYRESFISSLIGTPVLTYAVDIQESVVTPGKYRLVSPYGRGLDIDDSSATEFYKSFIETGSLGWDNTVNTNMVIDATDPNFVYIEDSYLGVVISGYGTVHVVNNVVYNLVNGVELDAIKRGRPEWFGKLVNGVISFPAQSQFVNFDTSYEGQYYGDSNGMFAIALPGYEITDFTADFEYKGRFTDTKEVDHVQGHITLGEDVARAKYAVAADGDDIAAIVDGIIDGSVESEVISESSDIEFILEETGTYYVVMVTYNSDDEPSGAYYKAFNFRSSKDGISEDEPMWEGIFSGDFLYNYEPNFIQDQNGNLVGSWFGEQTVSDVVLYADANHEGRYMVRPFGNNQKDGLIFEMDETGAITYKDVDTGTELEGYGEVYVGDFRALGGPTDGQPSSLLSDEGVFWFANVYYVEAGFVAGAYELFVPTAQINVAPYKTDVIEAQQRLKVALANKKFKPSMGLKFISAKKNLQSKPLARMKAKKVTTPMKLLK